MPTTEFETKSTSLVIEEKPEQFPEESAASQREDCSETIAKTKVEATEEPEKMDKEESNNLPEEVVAEEKEENETTEEEAEKVSPKRKAETPSSTQEEESPPKKRKST